VRPYYTRCRSRESGRLGFTATILLAIVHAAQLGSVLPAIMVGSGGDVRRAGGELVGDLQERDLLGRPAAPEGDLFFHARGPTASAAVTKLVPSLRDSANSSHSTQHCASGSVLG
jgi:hypothetical protein